MSYEMTPWFATLEKPKRPGVYLTRIVGIRQETCYSYYNGFLWGVGYFTVEEAYERPPCHPLACQNKQWRGCVNE